MTTSLMNKTKTEILYDKILSLESRIQNLKENSINNETEVVKLNEQLNQLKQIHSKISSEEISQSKTIDEGIKSFKQEGISLLSLDIIKLKNENIELQKEILSLKSALHKNDEVNFSLQATINKLINTNSELSQINKLQEEHIANLKGRVFEDNPRIELNKKRNQLSLNDQIIPEGQNMNNNLWDRSNLGYNKESKIDEFAKEKNLWIGSITSNSNMQQLKGMNDKPDTNMRKYSQLLISNKN